MAEGCREKVRQYRVEDEGVPTHTTREQVSAVPVTSADLYEAPFIIRRWWREAWLVCTRD